jgi:hypothetical protein
VLFQVFSLITRTNNISQGCDNSLRETIVRTCASALLSNTRFANHIPEYNSNISVIVLQAIKVYSRRGWNEYSVVRTRQVLLYYQCIIHTKLYLCSVNVGQVMCIELAYIDNYKNLYNQQRHYRELTY